MPSPDTLTYQGIFNQNSYTAGDPERSALLAVSTRAGRMLGLDGSEEVWVACFLKSCRDGQPRDTVPIDLVVVLDVSGSMSWGLSGNRNPLGMTRLDLAKSALNALLPKLRANDRFGLATFTTEGTVLQPLAEMSTLNVADMCSNIGELNAGGGTTIAAGMAAATGICEGASSYAELRYHRLLFLTDMDDMNPGELNDMIGKQAEQGLFVSFVGIGQEFNASLAEVVSRHPGANYFCVTRNEEMQQVIVDEFDWNFFPACFNVELAHQLEGDMSVETTYGTPFDSREEAVMAPWHPSLHRFYDSEFQFQVKTFSLCARRYLAGPLPMPALERVLACIAPSRRTIVVVDTVFPTAVHDSGAVKGGLILLKLRQPSAKASAVRLTLRYSATRDGPVTSACQDIVVPTAGVTADLDQAIKKGVTLQRYVEACSSYLIAAQASADEKAERCSASLQRIAALLAAFEAEGAALEQRCPGLCNELQDFDGMAKEHFRLLDQ